jgi:LPXTG-motif cell wall-anchored protein
MTATTVRRVLTLAAATTFVAGVGLLAATPASADPITITDPALLACVKAELGLAPSDPAPEQSVAAGITELHCDNKGVASLAGIGDLTGLTLLDLGTNSIGDDDLPMLATLTGLTKLFLDSNQITAPGPLGNLPALEMLFMSNNEITSLDGLGALPSTLTDLGLNDNKITDVSPLAGLSPAYLGLVGNWITDVHDLSALVPVTQADDQTPPALSAASGVAFPVPPVRDFDGAPLSVVFVGCTSGATYVDNIDGTGTFTLATGISTDTCTLTWENDVVEATSGRFGGTFTVNLSEAPPEDPATPTPPTRVPPAACGVEATVQIPANENGFTYTQTRSGNIVTVTATPNGGAATTWTFDVAATPCPAGSAPPRELPTTGPDDVAGQALVAGGAVLLGVGLLVVRRRRRHA